ncbi:MAG: ABC transporter ATP-binding protein [Thermoleophilia bacterium]
MSDEPTAAAAPAPDGEPVEAPPALVAEGLVGGYVPEVDILRGCTLTAADGEIVVVIGPNGAGKSTLAKAVFGLVKLREGAVRLRGEDVTGAAPHHVTAKGMSYVPQVANVFASLSVQENLEVGGVLNRRATRRRMDEMMALFPRLGERRRQRAGTLSGGERQMLAMARALMPEPSVLLLDEPSAGLAPLAVTEVFETVADINRSGVTIVMIEQNARRALALADRGYVLEGGRNRFEGPGDALLVDPQVAELYLGGAGAGGRGAPPAT